MVHKKHDNDTVGPPVICRDAHEVRQICNKPLRRKRKTQDLQKVLQAKQRTVVN